MARICGFLSERDINLGLEKFLLSCYPIKKPSGQLSFYLQENIGLATIGQSNLAKSSDGRYVCSVDGNIHNCESIDLRIRKKEPGLHSLSSSDILLNCYLQEGPEVFKMFEGGFVAAIIDTQQREITLIRDNFGMRIIYYVKSPNGIIFSSNLTGIARSIPFNKTIDPSGFIEYLACGYISAPWTIYEKVSCLRPGEYLVFKDNLSTVWCFSDYEIPKWQFLDTRDMSEKDLIARLDGLLSTSIRQKLPKRKKVAIYLSGGLDTSLLCATLKENTDQDIVAYTIGFRDESRDEIPDARIYAEYLKIDHRPYYLTKKDSIETFFLLPEINGQPFADISAIPTYIIASKVQEQFDTVFLGDGPDFLFGTYDMRLFYYYYKIVPPQFHRFIANLSGCLTERFLKKYMTPNLDVPELLRQPHILWTFTRMFKSNDLERLVGEPIYPQTFWTQRFIEGRPDIPLAERLRLAQYLCYGISGVLYKSCNAHNANLVDYICPFYDSEFVKFVQFLPTKYKFKGIYGKYLQKQLLYRKMPRQMVDKPKRGFVMDFKELGEDTIKNLTRKYLTKKRLGEIGLFKPEFALKCVEEYFKGNTNMGPKMWTLLIFELWREKFSI